MPSQPDYAADIAAEEARIAESHQRIETLRRRQTLGARLAEQVRGRRIVVGIQNGGGRTMGLSPKRAFNLIDNLEGHGVSYEFQDTDSDKVTVLVLTQ